MPLTSLLFIVIPFKVTFKDFVYSKNSALEVILVEFIFIAVESKFKVVASNVMLTVLFKVVFLFFNVKEVLFNVVSLLVI